MRLDVELLAKSKFYIKRGHMEFLGMVIALISVILICAKPKLEKVAFGLFIIAWLIAIIIYLIHVSSILPNMNL
ncbi:hypothetical protein BKH43_01815 [Helicobacter sp. 13S00401-1]|nr:hypothetical protein BKH43_01815 [Helicobacter sp. 13S00401-1]